jgi:hypothetical protein
LEQQYKAPAAFSDSTSFPEHFPAQLVLFIAQHCEDDPSSAADWSRSNDE